MSSTSYQYITKNLLRKDGLRFEAAKNIEIEAELLSTVWAQANDAIWRVSWCASLDKSGVDEIIFMPRILSLDFLLNFCVMAKVEKH